jgi:type I restriction enzyme, S subunit
MSGQLVEQWPITTLGEIATIKSGSGFPVKFQGNQREQFPFYKVGDMNNEGNEVRMENSNHTISEEIRRKLKAKIFPAGSIIFPKVGGAIRTNKKRIIVKECCVDNNVMGLIPNEEKILSAYLFYFMTSVDLFEFSNKAALPSIRQSTVSEWEIPVPSLEEQQRIVNILDEAFVNTKVGKSQTLKKIHDAEELFQSILHSILFPDNNNWVQTTIEESCNYRNGKAHEKDIHENGKYIVVNSKYISRDGKIKKYTNNLICPLYIDEIAMVLSDVPNGKALAKCILIDQEEKFSLNQRICAISSEHFIPKYLFFQLNRNRHFLSFNNGENQTNLRKNQVISCPLFKPPIDEQISIVEKLESLTEAYLLLMQKLLQEEECFINLENSLLQEAFNGTL